MRQVELEKVVHEKGNLKLKRTGQKLVTFIDKVTPDMVGAIIDLKKQEGLWVIDVIHDQDIQHHEIKRNWHVGGL
ncbi:MAG TPA: hypothetical protein VMR37_03565 [Rhabdochlamydiaceae bacterium]|jgi:hypothetical protein|nr:hypothetical protein [Rhabdochlamydiaceae bacterium]